MNELLPAYMAIIAGLIGLVWGADRFVVGAASAAKNFGIAPMVIGLTVVSIGTSAPEIIVSINAALEGSGTLAVGNALGSNLANIGLVLGVTALIAPLPAQRHLVFQEGPVLLFVTALAGYCLYDQSLGRTESLVMLLLIPLLLWVTVKYKVQHPDAEEVAEVEEIATTSNGAAAMWFIIGLLVMLLSSKILVWGAITTAAQMGISELVIGLTVVAIGTSLPELAASVTSALRGHHDIAIGNVFGSNLFNFLAVMPIAGVISPLQLDGAVFYRDYLAVTALTLLLLGSIAVHYFRKRKLPHHATTVHLSRKFGGVMLVLYVLYFVVLLPTS
ncbi:MAG: calcium/sodium antiporter [Gammaproteobacteria bacterium]|nr:calcium/sodium antiporter [Gammaproteobacteria bacterium]MBQ0839704.1 calcium/sodium antiporter [Gammaproteobacteria bacterium]